MLAACGGSPPAPPAAPTIKVTQDAQHVHLHFTNPNRNWSVRDLPYDIDFRDKNGVFLASYLQPDRKSKDPAIAACCLIHSLPAGGFVVIDLPPVRGVIADVSVTYGKGHWTRT